MSTLPSSLSSDAPIVNAKLLREITQQCGGNSVSAEARILEMGFRLPFALASGDVAHSVLHHCGGDRIAAATMAQGMGLRLPPSRAHHNTRRHPNATPRVETQATRRLELNLSKTVTSLSVLPTASAAEASTAEDEQSQQKRRRRNADDDKCKVGFSDDAIAPIGTAISAESLGYAAMNCARSIAGAPRPLCNVTHAAAFARRMRRMLAEGGAQRAAVSVVFHWTPKRNFVPIDNDSLQVPGGASGVNHQTDVGFYGNGIYTCPDFDLYRGYGGDADRAFLCLGLPGRQFAAKYPEHLGAARQQGYDTHISGDDLDGPMGSQWVFFSADQLLTLFLVDEKGLDDAISATKIVAACFSTNISSIPDDAPALLVGTSSVARGCDAANQLTEQGGGNAAFVRGCSHCGGPRPGWEGCACCAGGGIAGQVFCSSVGKPVGQKVVPLNTAGRGAGILSTVAPAYLFP